MSKSLKLYEELINKAESKKNPSARTKRLTVLSNVKKSCDLLDDMGRKITPTAVGRKCEELFGTPKIQSIRNSPTELVLYINLRQSERNSNIVVEKKNPLELHTDPNVRTQFDILNNSVDSYKEKNNKLQLELKSLKKLLSNLKINEDGTHAIEEESFKELLIEVIHKLKMLGFESTDNGLELNNMIIIKKDDIDKLLN